MGLGNIDFYNTYYCRFPFLNFYLRVSFNTRKAIHHSAATQILRRHNNQNMKSYLEHFDIYEIN